MMTMRFIQFTFFLVVILLSACSKSPSEQHINFAISQAPLNLDPRYATDAASERINRLLYQRLVEFDAQSKPVPSLANWTVLSPTSYQFVLRKDIQPFHHNTALTAEDVKATYDSLIELTDSAHAAEYANIKQITVQDAYTVEVQLKTQDTHFPEKMIIGILPLEYIAKAHDFGHHPIGNGVFAFESWDRALTLKRVDDGQLVTFTEVKDPTVRVLKLLRGETDLVQGDLPPELVKYLQTKPEVNVVSTQGTNFSYLGLNMQDPTLKNLKVRQAIAHAIDRQAIINQVMVKSSRLASVILPPEHYAGNASLKPYLYKPSLAKQLLQEAGIKLPLKLIYKTSTDAQRVRLATILQAQMAPAGIDLEIRSLDWGTFFDEVKKGQFQLYGLTWVGIKTPEIYTKVFGSGFMPPNGFNRGQYVDAELDAMLEKEDWPNATDRIYSQLPYIPLWYEGQIAAMRKNIEGYTPASDGNWDNLATIKRTATISSYAN